MEQRLHHTSQDIHEAYEEFRKRGGGAAAWKKGSSVGVPLSVLTNKLAAADFTSVNDQYVADHYEAAAKARLKRDRERKQTQRQTIAGQGGLSGAVMSQLKTGYRLREARIKVAKASPDAPHWLTRMTDTAFFGLVWLDKQALSLAGRKHGSTHIAHHMREHMTQFAATDLNVLRNRVARALKRFPDLERLMLADGAACWPESQA